MLSFGIEASRAFWIAVASAGFASGSPPPSRAATVTARASFVNCWPRFASAAAFLCLIEDHFEWPDISAIVWRTHAARATASARGPRPHGRAWPCCLHRHAGDAGGGAVALDGDPADLDLHRVEALRY